MRYEEEESTYAFGMFITLSGSASVMYGNQLGVGY